MTQISIISRLLLLLRHFLYARDGQEENPACRFLAANGQPRPEAYLQIRKLYDSLGYAYCPGARVFSYESLHNFVLMYPPSIPEPYTGEIDFGCFTVMTDNSHYADLLRSKLKNATYNRYHYVHVVHTGRFASLRDYLDFLELVVFFERGALLGAPVMFEIVAVLNLLLANQPQPESPPIASRPPRQPEDRLAIDYGALARNTRRQDTWI